MASTAELFRAANVPAEVYVRLLNRELGPGWVQWEPETLRSAVRTKILTDSVDYEDHAWPAIFAAKTVMGNPDVFSTRLEGFENVVMGLNSHQPDFDAVEIASPAEINYAVQVAKVLVRDLPRFSEDVVAYIRACFKEAGVFAYPSALLEFEPDHDKDIRNKIRLRADTMTPGADVKENLIDIQAAKLYDVEHYAVERMDMAKEELASAGK